MYEQGQYVNVQVDSGLVMGVIKAYDEMLRQYLVEVPTLGGGLDPFEEMWVYDWQISRLR